MNSVFSEQILADKLSKLNSTQQCIETLSHWCIFHRSKAELVVRTWDKQFHNSQMAQKVPLLYLANDILQNSKRKGNEFVNEFWKFLPSALKDIVEKGDDSGRNVVTRLVNIWEERRVFGSREKCLKDVILGEEIPPPLELNKKRRPIRIIKRDSRSIRTKLSIGGAAEKIISAFHSVLAEHSVEDAEMSKCKTSVNRVRRIEKGVDTACTNARDPNRIKLAKELEEEGVVLQQCIERLKLLEANRLTLVTQLREALLEQESELENVRTQMQVAQAQMEEASNMRKRLKDQNFTGISKPLDTNTREGPRSTAADLADKLTASTSSQLIMSSILSTFAAQEAKNVSLMKSTESNETQLQVSNAFVMAQPQQYQAQYNYVRNPTPNQQYMQHYGFGSVTPMAPPSQMANSMVPLGQQPLQMTAQQPPSAPNYRPIQPPAMYYTHPHHSQ